MADWRLISFIKQKYNLFKRLNFIDKSIIITIKSVIGGNMKKTAIIITAILSAVSLNLIMPSEILANDVENIIINRPIELSYKSKQDIYNIRKFYVAKSIFARPDYEPSEEVFGGIEDYKPWISMDWGFDSNSPNRVLETNGPSSHSRSLINPSLPAIIDYPFSIPRIPEYINDYTQMPQIMVPISAVYLKPQKEVDITYRNLIPSRGGGAYQITAINARDMGYNYMYLDKSKSTYNIKFMSNDNLSTSVKEITDFIHLGEACGVQGGCNNWSVSREDMQFNPVASVNNQPLSNNNQNTQKTNQYKSTTQVHSLSMSNDNSSSSYTSGNTTVQSINMNSGTNPNNNTSALQSGPCLFLKLWKERPSTVNSEADLNVKFIFK